MLKKIRMLYGLLTMNYPCNHKIPPIPWCFCLKQLRENHSFQQRFLQHQTCPKRETNLKGRYCCFEEIHFLYIPDVVLPKRHFFGLNKNCMFRAGGITGNHKWLPHNSVQYRWMHDLLSIDVPTWKNHWLMVEPTHLKNMLVKLDHATPRRKGWKFQKYLSCHHLLPERIICLIDSMDLWKTNWSFLGELEEQKFPELRPHHWAILRNEAESHRACKRIWPFNLGALQTNSWMDTVFCQKVWPDVPKCPKCQIRWSWSI